MPYVKPLEKPYTSEELQVSAVQLFNIPGLVTASDAKRNTVLIEKIEAYAAEVVEILARQITHTLTYSTQSDVFAAVSALITPVKGTATEAAFGTVKVPEELCASVIQYAVYMLRAAGYDTSLFESPEYKGKAIRVSWAAS